MRGRMSKNTRGKVCVTKSFMRICRVHAPGKIERVDDWPFDEDDQDPAEEAGSPASCPESYALKKNRTSFMGPLVRK
jgi:hypothetical protein